MVIVVACFLLASGNPSRSSESADSILTMIQEKYSHLKSFTADFTQSFESKALGSGITERGKLYIRIPSQMRWDYEKPEEKIAICNGTDSWLYIKDDNIAVKANLAASGGSQALVSLLTGMVDLRDLFEGELISKAHGEVIAKIRLKEENDQFDFLLITVNTRQKRLTRIEVFDLLGNRMVYSFNNIEENVEVKPELFQFSIPPGARLKFE
ncbi:MAG: outer membrane lipoprotein carrier protein LolA [Acidobacteriota bacterium]